MQAKKKKEMGYEKNEEAEGPEKEKKIQNKHWIIVGTTEKKAIKEQDIHFQAV